MDRDGGSLVYLIIVLIVSVVFGMITKHINESKGYEGGFWWGFLLSWIGIIVVALKPDNNYRYNQPSYNQPSYNQPPSYSGGGYNSAPTMNEWKCNRCGQINSDYVTTCSCGRPKNFNPDTPKAEIKATSTDVSEELRKYKKLFDDGLINEEELNAKKKQLLGL